MRAACLVSPTSGTEPLHMILAKRKTLYLSAGTHCGSSFPGGAESSARADCAAQNVDVLSAVFSGETKSRSVGGEQREQRKCPKAEQAGQGDGPYREACKDQCLVSKLPRSKAAGKTSLSVLELWHLTLSESEGTEVRIVLSLTMTLG